MDFDIQDFPIALLALHNATVRELTGVSAQQLAELGVEVPTRATARVITKKDFGADGSTIHAGGHAYLIVGYRELPEMPEEGGICFVVKSPGSSSKEASRSLSKPYKAMMVRVATL